VGYDTWFSWNASLRCDGQVDRDKTLTTSRIGHELIPFLNDRVEGAAKYSCRGCYERSGRGSDRDGDLRPTSSPSLTNHDTPHLRYELRTNESEQFRHSGRVYKRSSRASSTITFPRSHCGAVIPPPTQGILQLALSEYRISDRASKAAA
jgi:hypothetical protein